MKENLIFAGAFFNLFFVVVHLLFWKMFKWKTELPKMMRLNQVIMVVMNIFLMITFVMFAAISLLHPHELMTTSLGRTILISISLWWLLRAFAQVIWFDMKKPVSWIFLLLFFIGSALYGIPAMPAVNL